MTLQEIETAQRALLAKMAGALQSWKDNDLLPVYVRETCARLNDEDELLRAETRSEIDRMYPKKVPS